MDLGKNDETVSSDEQLNYLLKRVEKNDFYRFFNSHALTVNPFQNIKMNFSSK